MDNNKRKSEMESALVMANKKSRNDMAIINKNKQLQSMQQNIPRTSNLFAPIMLLEGHEGDIFSLDFHPEGQYLASSGFDRKILLWSVYGECENISSLSGGHSGAIMQIQFCADGSHVYSASTDHTIGIWDIVTSTRIKRLRGHTGFVNSVCGARRGTETLVTGSDDCSLRIWDVRRKGSVAHLEHNYQVLSVALGNDTSIESAAVYSGGIDNDICIWDIRQRSIVSRLKGHTDTVTGLSVSPGGSYLLSNSMDNTLRIWDIRPFAPAERCVKVFTGHQHNFERNLLRCAWSPEGSRVTAGSADRFVYIWDTTSRRILYKLPGHNGSVNDVQFHTDEPIVASASSDKNVYMGEIATIGNLAGEL